MDNIESQCAEAAARLEGCLGAAPEGFEEACRHDPSPETLEIVDELVGSECTEDMSERADLGESAFIFVCKPALGAAFLVTRARNDEGEPIALEDADTLRPYFGDVVDTAVVYWNALIIDEWTIFGKHIQFSFDVLAQTFAQHIFYDDTYQPGNHRQLAVVGHELTHTEQAARFGGLSGFAREYCRAFYQSGFSYENNALEIEAEEREQEVRNCLLNQVGCR